MSKVHELAERRIRVPEHVRKQIIACAAQEDKTGKPARLVLYPKSLSRRYSHRTLIRALIEVIERDDSLSKLYAGLLANQVLVREPKLQRQYSRQLADV
jgi:hypothetical protein